MASFLKDLLGEQVRILTGHALMDSVLKTCREPSTGDQTFYFDDEGLRCNFKVEHVSAIDLPMNGPITIQFNNTFPWDKSSLR